MDQKLKQRLVGAIVLISLAIIFIPVILEGPDDDWTPRVQEIPVPPQIEYQAEVDLVVPEESPAPVPEVTTAAELPVPEAPATAAAPPPVEDPVPVKAEPVAKQPAPKPKPAVPAGSWVIQVGSFSQQLNASGLRDRLQKTGYNSRLQEISAGNGKAWRVLVGPFETRAAAEKQRDRITGEHHMKGIVTQFKG